MSTTITINQQPSGLVSANNDVIFVASSSAPFAVSSSNYNFYKLTADVYVNGQYQTTLKSFPDPTYGTFVFNTRNVLDNFVSYDFPFFVSHDTASVFHTASNSSVNAYLSFGEEYFFTSSFTSSIFIQNKNLVTSSNLTFLNSALTFLDQVNLNLSTGYVISDATSSAASFLTSANFSIPTYSDLRNYLYYYSSASLNQYLNIFTYDVNGNQLGNYLVYNGAYVGFHGVQYMSVGYPQLSSLISGSAFGPTNLYQVRSGNPVLMNPAVSSYTVQLIGDGSAARSEKMTFQIQQDCGRWSPYSYAVYWLNEFGGFDSWLFNKKNLTTSKKNSATYKKIYGGYKANGQYAINTYDNNQAVYYTSVQDTIQMSTDYLTDQQVIFLKGLFSSPVIYIQDPQGNLISATIKDDGYTLNKRVNQRIYSLSVNMDVSYNDYRQQL